MDTILITGANRGIGLELAKQYLNAGWQVIACCRDPANANELNKLAHQQLENKKLLIAKLDVTHSEDIKRLANELKDFSIDICINNAGIWGPSDMSFGAIEPNSWLKAFEINTIAPLMLAQALINQIARSKHKIIANISSIMGSVSANTEGNTYVYRSSKAALNAVTKSLAIDLKPKDITVVALHPGWVKTAMGGPDAEISAEQSVAGIKKILSSLTLNDTGCFISYDDKVLSW